MDVRQRTEEIEHLTFAPWATFSDASRGRAVPEPQDASEISIDRMRRRGNKREISGFFMKHSFPGVAGRSSIDMLNGWE